MAKKKSTVKPAARRGGAVQKSTPAAPSAAGGKKFRSTWLDDQGQKPIIDRYARQLDTFLVAMADGRIDAEEIAEQEGRLVRLMKFVEPLLNPRQHELVTQLLCELTAYDIMQIMHAMEQMRPKTQFRG